MKVRLNKAHFPVTVLGPGRRIGLWVQGCSIGCPGCLSRDTWAADSGREMEIADLLAWCREVGVDGIDGVTISGGEPFEQSEALAALLDGMAVWRSELTKPFDILCYSGFPLRRLFARYGDLLRRLDALIPEPYSASRPRGDIWRGSDNQPLVILSALGRARYADAAGARPEEKARFQISVTERAIWFIGIPDRGDLGAMEDACARMGISLMEVSWRA